MADSCSKFQATSQDPGPSYGSYVTDLAWEKYTHSWDSLCSMELWLQQEQQSKFIELWLKERERSKSEKWTEKLIYTCVHQGTGEKRNYKKKQEDRGRKIPSKRYGCMSHLIVKCYLNTEQVLDLYTATHSHPIGQDNARFMCLPEENCVQIIEMLCMGVTHEHIVRNVPLLQLRVIQLRTPNSGSILRINPDPTPRLTPESPIGMTLCHSISDPWIPPCKCVMHLLSHHAPTGAWYFVDTISSSIIVIVCTSGMRPYRRIPR